MASTIDIKQALTQFGYSLKGARIEAVLTQSMNNTLFNVNYNGLTWAAKLLAPPEGSGPEGYLEEKRRTVEVSSYLAERFREGIPMAEDEVFRFDQEAVVVESQSATEFLRTQARMPPFRIIDTISQRRYERAGVEVPAELLRGPYLAQKGAPAKETLKDSSMFGGSVLRALCTLHKATGLEGILEERDFARRLASVREKLRVTTDGWNPSAGKPQKKIAKYEGTFNESGSAAASQAIRREVFLQTDEGDAAYRRALHKAFEDVCSDARYLAFSHGDAHGENFIIVQYEFEREHGPAIAMDREYLNELFQARPELMSVEVDSESEANGLVVREPRSGTGGAGITTLRRRRHREVQVIDVDTGKGLPGEEQEFYGLDLVKCLLSIDNWSIIHGGPAADLGSMINVYFHAFHST